jgi:AcrR family transcriptional regulator
MTTPPAVARRTPRAEVRERILNAAADVFADQGFSGASIDAVAAAAGFTKGAVYSNFATKNELFFALMEARIDERVAAMREVVAAVRDPTERTFALGEVLTAAMKNNDRWQLLFTEFWLRAMRDPQVREQWVTHRRQHHEQLTALVDEVLRGSSMSSELPARNAMFVLLAAANGLAIEELADPGSTPPDLLGQVFALLTKRDG